MTVERDRRWDDGGMGAEPNRRDDDRGKGSEGGRNGGTGEMAEWGCRREVELDLGYPNRAMLHKVPRQPGEASPPPSLANPHMTCNHSPTTVETSTCPSLAFLYGLPGSASTTTPWLACRFTELDRLHFLIPPPNNNFSISASTTTPWLACRFSELDRLHFLIPPPNCHLCSVRSKSCWMKDGFLLLEEGSGEKCHRLLLLPYGSLHLDLLLQDDELSPEVLLLSELDNPT